VVTSKEWLAINSNANINLLWFEVNTYHLLVSEQVKQTLSYKFASDDNFGWHLAEVPSAQSRVLSNFVGRLLGGAAGEAPVAFVAGVSLRRAQIRVCLKFRGSG